MTSSLTWLTSSADPRSFPNLIQSQALILCTVAILMPPVRFLQREEAFPNHDRHPAAWNALHWPVPSSVQIQRHFFREAFPDCDPSVSSLFSQSVLALLHCAHLPEFVVIYLLISLFTVYFPHSIPLCEIPGSIPVVNHLFTTGNPVSRTQ